MICCATKGYETILFQEEESCKKILYHLGCEQNATKFLNNGQPYAAKFVNFPTNELGKITSLCFNLKSFPPDGQADFNDYYSSKNGDISKKLIVFPV